MVSIIAYVSTKTQPEKNSRHYDLNQQNIISRTDRNKERWDSIRRGNKNSRKITADDVTNLVHLATKVQKTAKGKYLVVINDRKEFMLMLAVLVSSTTISGLNRLTIASTFVSLIGTAGASTSFTSCPAFSKTPVA